MCIECIVYLYVYITYVYTQTVGRSRGRRRIARMSRQAADGDRGTKFRVPGINIIVYEHMRIIFACMR